MLMIDQIVVNRSNYRKRNAIRSKKATPERRPPMIRIGKHSIGFRKGVSCLGVYFGTQMSAKAHCSHIGEKIGKLYLENKLD